MCAELLADYRNNNVADDDFRERLPPFGATLRSVARKACSINVLKRRFPITLWLPKYRPQFIIQDMVAGITVALTAVPQSIAYAIVADLPPQYGLYSAFMGCFVYILFGSVTAVTVGPTALLAAMTQPFVSGKSPDFAVLLTFLYGVVEFGLGILNLGFLVQFISSSVISGFTTAAALSIASVQIKNIFGLPGQGSKFISAWMNFFKNIKHLRVGDTILGFGSLALLLLLKVKIQSSKQLKND